MTRIQEQKSRKRDGTDAFHALLLQQIVVFLTCCWWGGEECDVSCFGSSALQFLLDSHDQLAQHPVPLRRTPPGPATPCSPGANTERVHALRRVRTRCNPSRPCGFCRGQGGITEGLVKGALSVAASAYKALFTGPNCSVQVGSSDAPTASHTGLVGFGGGGVFWAHPADSRNCLLGLERGVFSGWAG